jgi:signal transduction histidine kinase
LELYRKKQRELSIIVKQRTYEITKANEILLERQTRIEEYAEELRTHTKELADANELLMCKQKLIEIQSKQLSDTNQQLSVLNSTKDRFFSIIAHDLRNPFHVIMGFSNMLIKDLPEMTHEKTIKFLWLIQNASKNGNDLLENLLQWSQSQTGRVFFEPAKIILAGIAEETINLAEGNIHRKNINLQQLIDLNVVVFADENMLKTIFRNLLSNAVKFTPDHGSITISSKRVENMVETTIADTGIGIPPENLSLLFRIDENLSTKGTANETGTGLGLILCKEFLEKNGGTILVESELGKGSSFKFTLPVG